MPGPMSGGLLEGGGGVLGVGAGVAAAFFPEIARSGVDGHELGGGAGARLGQLGTGSGVSAQRGIAVRGQLGGERGDLGAEFGHGQRDVGGFSEGRGQLDVGGSLGRGAGPAGVEHFAVGGYVRFSQLDGAVAQLVGSGGQLGTVGELLSGSLCSHRSQGRAEAHGGCGGPATCGAGLARRDGVEQPAEGCGSLLGGVPGGHDSPTISPCSTRAR